MTMPDSAVKAFASSRGLLAALKEMVAAYSVEGVGIERRLAAIKKARLAIARAEGRA